MGVVYEASDEQLGRTLAVKTLGGLTDETARKRFWREARAAASVNHPNICPLYEVGEDDGLPFIAMERLEGEPLSERVGREPLPFREAVDIALPILDALAAVHERGLVHRDLKPSNVFLTAHGVKLVDFGLARPTIAEGLDTVVTESQLTGTGMIVGTPRYMAPEQVKGDAVDACADLFAVGAILFEMVAGRPAFAGRTAVEILHATLYEQPPALTGSPAIAAIDRVIRKALAKAPRDRYPTARAMSDELRAALRTSGTDATAVARPLTRLVVLPFRPLRPDPETDFLGFALSDAISTSLSTLGSLVVRSSAAAARFASDSPDLQKIATEADVDHVVMGTLLRSGNQLRVTIQLAEAPSGTLISSHTVQSALGDLFALQDDLARRLTEALALPLGGRPGTADVPRNARAYEFYLRANEVARRYDRFHVARDLYLQCLEEDPDFAPAWARLGRCHRLIAKYLHEDIPANYDRSEEALRRALELNPDLSLAHKFFAQLEAERGRAPEGMVRLLRRAQIQRNDPELFSGLTHACRYCGLLEASVAAHEEARRLDPKNPSSVQFTLLWMGAHDQIDDSPESVMDLGPRVMSLLWQRRGDEARELVARYETLTLAAPMSKLLATVKAQLAMLDSPASTPREQSIQNLADTLGRQLDPEAQFLFACWLAHIGDGQRALEALQAAVSGGFSVPATLTREPLFEPLRTEPAFERVLELARRGRESALALFLEEGGDRLLGL
jgi:serine/threonine protein kinase/tetratricopeptide (TPR) repeat protein